jgi:peptidoglycan hydrolase CwlO-like protein
MDNNQIDLTWLWSTLGAVGSGFAGWLFGRAKQNAETKGTELDNVEKAVEIWREMASDLRGQFNALQTEVLTLQRQVTKLEIENERLKANNEELQAEIDELRKQILK